jgi:hypothetical protein
MKHQSNDVKSHDEVGKGPEEYNQVDDPIKASDSSRNDERDERIRSERQSMKKAQKNRHRPLL